MLSIPLAYLLPSADTRVALGALKGLDLNPAVMFPGNSLQLATYAASLNM